MPTKTQQALIQLAESMAITALIAGLFSIGTILATPGPVNWRQVGLAFGLAAAFSIAHSLATYFKSSNQVELGAAIEAVLAAIEQRFTVGQVTADQSPQPSQSATMLIGTPQGSGGVNGVPQPQKGSDVAVANPQVPLREGEATAPRLPVVQAGPGQ